MTSPRPDNGWDQLHRELADVQELKVTGESPAAAEARIDARLDEIEFEEGEKYLAQRRKERQE